MTTSAQQPAAPGPMPPDSGLISPLDLAVGLSMLAFGLAASLARRVRPVLEPVGRIVLSPPMLPPRFRPGSWLSSLARHGAEQRTLSRQDVSRLLDAHVPVVVEEMLRRADLTAMVTKYVDLDTVVAEVDLDAAAVRIDVDAVARRLDLDSVVGRLDLEPVLDRLDLTSIVLHRVDLDAVVSAIIARVDLVGLAEEVIDAIDLPEIIRESTGSMASDTVHGARMQGIAADEAVGRLIDRMLLRRGHKSGPAPEPDASPDRDNSGQASAQDDGQR